MQKFHLTQILNQILKGYKLHYGEFNGYSYASVLDLGNITDTTISGIDVGTNPAVTAYDNNADGTDDQVEGHESWFSEISLISAPVGVNRILIRLLAGSSTRY